VANKWVIPDIHGCYQTLTALFNDHINPKPEDHFYFLGDYIDRGPGSKAVIDFIIEMQKKYSKVVALKGNHEDYLLKAYWHDQDRKSVLGFRTKSQMQKEWEKQGGVATLKSFSVKWPSDFPLTYIEWLAKLPHYHELEKFVLLHAGLNFKIDDPFEDKHAMLWARDYEILPEKIQYKTIVHGHVPVKLEFIDRIIKSENQPFIDLDNGIYMPNRDGYGNLIALELNSMKYVVQPTLDTMDF
jgi:serine/threonine protein phosphatase 1